MTSNQAGGLTGEGSGSSVPTRPRSFKVPDLPTKSIVGRSLYTVQYIHLPIGNSRLVVVMTYAQDVPVMCGTCGLGLALVVQNIMYRLTYVDCYKIQ